MVYVESLIFLPDGLVLRRSIIQLLIHLSQMGQLVGRTHPQ